MLLDSLSTISDKGVTRKHFLNIIELRGQNADVIYNALLEILDKNKIIHYEYLTNILLDSPVMVHLSCKESLGE